MGRAMTPAFAPAAAVMAVPSSARSSTMKKAMNSLIVFRIPNTMKLVSRQVFWGNGTIKGLYILSNKMNRKVGSVNCF